MNFLDEKAILELEKGQKPNVWMVILFIIVIVILLYVGYGLSTGKITNFSDVSSGLQLLFGAFFFVFFYSLYKFNNKKLVNFWFRFSEINKGEYEPFKFFMENKSIMLNEGDDRSFEHIITFKNTNNALLKIFSYNIFKKEPGNKGGKNYNYWVFNFRYKGKLPHIFLDYLHDGFSVDQILPKRISLSEELDQKFNIFAPEKYEIEALEIFSTDILNFILEANLNLNIEIVDGDMFFFIRNKQMFNRKDLVSLQEIYNNADKLFGLMRERMDRMQLSKVGNLSEYL